MSIIEEMEAGVLLWYDFGHGKDILYLNTPEYFKGMVTEDNKGEYDFIIQYGIDNIAEPMEDYLSNIHNRLKKNGKLLLILDNKIGIRNFCSGEEKIGRYSKSEIQKILISAGFVDNIFFSVFPDYRQAQLIYREDNVPIENLENRYIPKYSNIDKVFLPESKLCDCLKREGILNYFANSYLVECCLDCKHCNVDEITLSLDRGREKSMITTIYSDHVEKRPAYPEGYKMLLKLSKNIEYLKERGITVVDTLLKDDRLIMPRINAVLANNYLQELLVSDRNLFLKRLDDFYELIMQSSDIIEHNEMGDILSKGFVDLVPLNCFWTSDRYLVFDQEYVEENIPANLIMLRTIIIIYDGVDEVNVVIDKASLYERYGITNCFSELSNLERAFVAKLRDNVEIQRYNAKHQIFPFLIYENYNRLFRDSNKMNFLIEEYKKHCFDDTHQKSIYVWGAGSFSDKFMCLYKDELDIKAIIDNEIERQGLFLYDVPIIAPEMLKQVESDFKVIICVKKCENIILQLHGMGISNIGVYDAHYIYFNRPKFIVNEQKSSSLQYGVGYISGVFDLYHIGHINMFRRAKEQCEYLIVGVASDEYVRVRKNREPFIPAEERAECVRSCKYVDEVFITPFKYGGVIEAFQKYHYDVQFCGSDYVNDNWWLEQKTWLEAHGSHLKFLSYTEQTSSTKIKALIEKGLL